MEKVVGNPDCTVEGVVSTIIDEDIVGPRLLEIWTEFASKLGLSQLSITQLKQIHQRGDNSSSIYDITVHILSRWRNFKSHEATLQSLIAVLQVLGLNEAVDRLKCKYDLTEYTIQEVVPDDGLYRAVESDITDSGVNFGDGASIVNLVPEATNRSQDNEVIELQHLLREVDTITNSGDEEASEDVLENPEEQQFIHRPPTSANEPSGTEADRSTPSPGESDRNETNGAAGLQHSLANALTWRFLRNIEWRCVVILMILLSTSIIIISLGLYFCWFNNCNAIPTDDDDDTFGEPFGYNDSASREINVHGYHEYLEKASDFGPNENVSMTLQLHQCDKWAIGSVMHNSSHIVKLSIKGCISLVVLSEILNQTKKLEYLVVDNEMDIICDFNRGEDVQLAKMFNLSSLKVLILTGIRECSEIIQTLESKMTAANLEIFRIEKGNLQSRNIILIQNILNKAKHSLRHLTIFSNFISEITSLLSTEMFAKLTKIGLKYFDPSSFSNITVVGIHSKLCQAVPNLTDLLVSSKTFLSIQNFREILQCKHLERLRIGVYLNGTDKAENVSVANALPNITTVGITFYSQTCTNSFNIAPFGLQCTDCSLKCVLITSINCTMAQCESDEEECIPTHSIQNTGQHCIQDRRFLHG